MKIRKAGLLILWFCIMSGFLIAQTEAVPPYKNPDLSVDARVKDLVSRMNLEEKVGQMMDTAKAIPRLDVPVYNWWNECLHGVARAGVATVFPQAIGLAATWDTELMFHVADVISTEARAKYHEAVRNGNRRRYYGLTFWSPNVNLFRDPRWGRGQETYGEDPYLTGRMGVAFVTGLQGNDPKYFKSIATPKHYVVHSGPEPLRHEFDAVTSARVLYDSYLPGFDACVREGGAYSVMCAYNRTLGKACCGSPPLMQTILRDFWGFEGYVVSDCGAVDDIHANHHLVKTRPEAAALAVKSGTDLNCGFAYNALGEAVKKGLITEAGLDVALIRLFTARMKLGMFDPPERVPFAQIPFEKNDCPEHQALALEAARESLVLLKNDNGLLPLDDKKVKTIAVIGPNADRESVLLGNYNGTPSAPVRILKGIRERAGDGVEVLYEKGCNLAGKFDMVKAIPAALLSCNGQPGLQAEYFDAHGFQGEPKVVRMEDEVNFNWWHREAFPFEEGQHFSVRWTGTLVPEISGDVIFTVRGNYDIRFFVNDEPVVEIQTTGRPDRKQAEKTLVAGEKYAIRLEYDQGTQFPFIYLAWAREDRDAFSRAIATANKADVIVFAGGISPELEGEEMDVPYAGFEGGDRTRIDLPDVQQQLIKSLIATNKPVVLVLNSGSALAVNWEQEHVPAIVQTWYPGQAGGTAVAEALFGDINPGGRLPVTFYRSVDQLPPFDDYSMTGHTYRFFKDDPLYAFGYGMSYTTFAYSDLKVPKKIRAGEPVPVSVKVKNTGTAAGDEVVQVYVKDIEASVPVPLWSLQGFRRVSLAPGEEQTVEFTLEPKQLALITDNLERLVEPGEFTIAVGGGLPGAAAATTDVITKTLNVTGKPAVVEVLVWEDPE
ncbi:glycoside hydrolase family 3 C-terminal domain-containing protein [bacterium]|nr:glycoside hydrolase family 3 C-terminal domain-containing protein [bacterium]